MGKKTMNYSKFVATAATATLVATAIMPVAFAEDTASTPANFKDVSGHYKIPVEYLYKNNIIEGMTKDVFGTQQSIKRVDVAVMISRALLTDAQIENAPASGFKDVPARAVKNINAMKEAGFINGKTDTLFGSDALITRGEVAMILARAYGLKGNVANLQFKDVSGHYKEGVAALVDNNITKGKATSTFGTNDSLTRGELAIFLYNAETMETAGTELSVTSVSPFVYEENKTTVVHSKIANAPENAKATVVLYSYDKNGELKEEIRASDVKIDKGAIAQTFDLKDFANGKYRAVVTVSGVEGYFDFNVDFTNVDAAVKAVNDAPSQVALHTALQNPLFKSYNSNLIIDYRSKLGVGQAAQSTVAGVQAVIDEVNSNQANAELIAKLKAAPNQVELLNLLSGFEAVNSKLVSDYEKAIKHSDVVLTTNKDVQNLINYINAENTVSSMISAKDASGVPTALAEGVTQAKIDAAKLLVDKLAEGYVLVPNDKTKAALTTTFATVQQLFATSERAKSGLVATEAELKTALSNKDLTKITLEKDITVTNAIALSGKQVLDGANHTLTINTPDGGASSADGLSVTAGSTDVAVKNIKITTTTHKDNLIEIYGNATLDNVSALNGQKAGIYVNNTGTSTLTVNFKDITTSGNAWKAGIGLVAQQAGSKVVANFSGAHSFGEETAVYTDDATTYKGTYEVNGLTGYTKNQVGNQTKWTKTN